MLTPTDIIRQSMRVPTNARRASSRQPAPLLDPNEEASLIRKISEPAMGGISAVGNILDLPGSTVRDTVALATGKPANPLNQWLPWNWMSSDKRVTGRELNRHLGLSGRKDTWGNFGGGLATEVALDPLTYMTFGASALGKGGKVAKAAGLMDNAQLAAARKLGTSAGKVGSNQARVTSTLGDLIQAGGPGAQEAAERAAGGIGVKVNDIIDQPLGGMVKFRGPMAMLFGDTPKGGTGWATGVDKTKQAFHDFRVPGTDFRPVSELRRAFDARVKEAVTPEGRQAAQRLTSRQGQSIASARGKVADLTNRLEKMGMASQDEAMAIREVFEVPEVFDSMPPEVQQWAKEGLDELGKLLPRAQEYGINLRELVDPLIEYFPRYLSSLNRKTGGMRNQVVSTMDPSKLSRLDFIREIPGGTKVIADVAQDADINRLIEAGADTDIIADTIRQKYGGQIPDEYLPIESIDDAGNPVYKPPKDRPKAMAEWLKGLSKETREAGVFGNHPLADLQTRLANAGQSVDAAHTLMETLAQKGVMKQAAAGVDSVSVKQLFQDAGIKLGDKNQGGLAKLSQMMGMDIASLPDDAAADFMNGLKSMVVDKDLAADMTRFLQGFKAPEAVGELTKWLVDFPTNLFKSLVTSPWPAFHSRNFTSGQFRNWVAGMWDPSSVNQAKNLMRGNAIDGASQWKIVQDEWARRGKPVASLTDEEATKLLGEMAYAQSVVGRFTGEQFAQAGVAPSAGATIDDILSEMMGTGRKHVSAKRTAGKVTSGGRSSLNPLNVRGIGGRTQSQFAPAVVGEDLGHFVEGLNRLGPWLKQIKEGVDPAEAARKVKAAQVDYSGRAYTRFEREGMTRALPFYKFLRGNTPYVIQTLLENPGGKMGQTIRAMNRARNPSEITPEYVSSTASVPLNGVPIVGGAPEGTRRYLTGFGLMMEDPLSLVGGNPLLELASRANPVLKAPAEWATGQSFFQRGPVGGRPLEDLDPTIGRTLRNVQQGAGLTKTEDGYTPPVRFPFQGPIEFLFGNSPAARLLTSARTATDPRKNLAVKALNLGTGFRISDVSPAAQDALIREQAAKLMKQIGAKEFTSTYFPKEQLEEMDPRIAQDAAVLQSLMNTLAARAKKRAAEKN